VQVEDLLFSPDGRLNMTRLLSHDGYRRGSVAGPQHCEMDNGMTYYTALNRVQKKGANMPHKAIRALLIT